MWKSKIQATAFILMAVLLLLGVSASIAIDSDFGKIDVTTVTIKNGDKELSAIIYRSQSADTQNPAPAVIAAHGICGSKEMMSSIGLELARRGFVSLCLDLLGHGKSQGSVEEGRTDPTFGVHSAVQYLKSQPYVNSSLLGLVGHSLGAGAVRATLTRENQIGATVLVAGGLQPHLADEPEYGVFNATHPKNLLVIVGKYDVLFDIKELTSNELPPAFGVQQQIVPEVLYGEFISQTARKLVIPSTTHFFEPVDPTIISEIVAWSENSLGKRQDPASAPTPQFLYVQREAAILLALASLVGIALLSYFPTRKLIHIGNEEGTPTKGDKSSHKWRLHAFWAVLNLALLLPMFAIGSIIAFPPLVFGSSIALWMMITGSIGLMALVKFPNKILGKTYSMKQALTHNFNKKEAVGAIISFNLILLITTIIASGVNFNFRIISPVFRDFTTARALVFPTFIPFFFLYFASESLFLHDLPRHDSNGIKTRHQIQNYVEPVLGKILPFAILLAFHFSSKIFFDFWVLPSFVGFLLEFLWLILPIFVITTIISWWFHKNTQRAGYGALLNALLMSWVASVVFPF